jgi:hypothetical protein
MKPGRPAAHVTIAGRRLSAAEAALAGMSVSLGRFSHDRARIIVWPQSKFASASAGGEMKIELGTDAGEVDVWTGKIRAVYAAPEAVCIEGLAPTAVLSSERRSQTYLNQGAADVVRDLASSVDVDDADTSLQLEYYAVDARRSVWGHVVDLAMLAGAETTTSPSGGLRFVEVRPKPALRTFRYKADLLHWQVGAGTPRNALAYAPGGAASEAGSDKWHWISQESAPDPAVSAGAFRSKSSADALGKASAAYAARAAVHGRIRVIGASDLRAGDVFALEDLPAGDPGDLRATSVTHHFSGARGCWTDAIVEGAGGAGALGGLL